ncbi:MAG: hypothetical protein BPHS0_43 [Phage 5P_3]|nr:MAG: hypothetical protein BPHS0_43 [Phage 5P_3]
MAQLKNQMMFNAQAEEDEFYSVGANIDQSTVEQGGVSYPYIQWVHGKSDLEPLGLNNVRYTGGWFTPAEQFIDAPEGWEKGVMTHRDLTETEGYFKRDLTVAMIRMRRCWLVGINGQTQAFPYDQYDAAAALGRAVSKAQVLCLVKGMEGLGPFVLTMRGTVASEFANAKSGVIGLFKRLIVDHANTMNKKRGLTTRWAYRGFWLTVGPQRNDKGEPIYTKVGQGTDSAMVTLPCALGLPEKPSDEAVRAAFVGRALWEEIEPIYADSESWKAAWDQTSPSAQPVTGAPNGYAYAEESAEEKPTEEIPF